jgi:hypothetical protein
MKFSEIVDWKGKQKGIWGENPEKYLGTLDTIAQQIIDNP